MGEHYHMPCAHAAAYITTFTLHRHARLEVLLMLLAQAIAHTIYYAGHAIHFEAIISAIL